MGKIISQINTTPDGFADSEFVIVDAEYYDFTHELMSEAGTIGFGRKTFELFQGRFEAILEKNEAPAWRLKMAQTLHQKPKTVYSSTLETTSWPNSTVIQKVEADYINTLKQEGGLLTFGSLELVSTLAAMELIDDYYFCIEPLLGGRGNVRLFDKIKLDGSRPLHYVDSKQLKSGVHIIHYEREN